MVPQDDAQDPDQKVTQEGLLQLYVQIDQRMIVLHVELHTKLGSALHCLLCFKCNKQGHYAKLCHSKIQSTTSIPSSNRNTRRSWHSRGGGGRGHGSKHAVYEVKTTETSKPTVDASNSEVDVVTLLQAYGMVPTEGCELKHRKKKVATDKISIIQTLGDDFTFEPKPLVLHGSPVECNIGVQWESSNEDIMPINLYIATHTVSMEVANPLDWSFDVHLIELDMFTQMWYIATWS